VTGGVDGRVALTAYFTFDLTGLATQNLYLDRLEHTIGMHQVAASGGTATRRALEVVTRLTTKTGVSTRSGVQVFTPEFGRW
jgi:hypothetical protein